MPNQRSAQIGVVEGVGLEPDDLRGRVAELERELERCQRLATLGTLAASIAHEFNNLLTPIVSYAQMALHSPEDWELVSKALRKAIEGSEKASEIASSMLGFIRDDEGACVHVAHAAHDALACLAREPSKDGIELEIDVDRECWVRMRPVALEQVLLNLILNAREAMRPGGGRLSIRAQRSTWNPPHPHPPHRHPHHPPHPSSHSPAPGATTSPDGVGAASHGAPADSGGSASSGEAVVLEVTDSGCGIDEAMLGRLFEPFARDPKRGRSSSGLGLSICKRLVEEAGGTIEATSAAGAGTTFRMTLVWVDPAEIREAA